MINIKMKQVRWEVLHIQQRNWRFMWIKILWIEYILWGILETKSMIDVAITLKKLL